MLTTELKLKVAIKFAADGKYGHLVDGKWDGLVGEVLNNVADMAIGPLTITYDREKVVYFTKPFMNLGVSILYRTPTPEDPGPFSFLKPLDPKVWMSILVASVRVIYTTTDYIEFRILKQNKIFRTKLRFLRDSGSISTLTVFSWI